MNSSIAKSFLFLLVLMAWLSVPSVEGQSESSEQTPSIAEIRSKAEAGDAYSQFKLGASYGQGKGVPQDYAEAVKLIRLAADQGNANAQYNVGVMYYKGQGVRKDNAEALEWWRMLADQGDANAQFELGLAYRDGNGVPQDHVLAHMWLNLAAMRSSGDAQKRSAKDLDSISKKLTPQQLTEAERMAREWKPETEVAISAGVETLRFSPGEHWVIGNDQKDEAMSLTEMVPKGETVENWTEIITMITTSNSPNANLDELGQAQKEASIQGCTTGHRFEEKERGQISGLPMLILVVRCESGAKGSGTDKSVWGKPETYVSLMIAGHQNVYTVMRAARRSDLSEATIQEWIDFLKTAQICNSQDPLSPCKRTGIRPSLRPSRDITRGKAESFMAEHCRDDCMRKSDFARSSK